MAYPSHGAKADMVTESHSWGEKLRLLQIASQFRTHPFSKTAKLVHPGRESIRALARQGGKCGKCGKYRVTYRVDVASTLVSASRSRKAF